jgi:hypothetical protein
MKYYPKTYVAFLDILGFKDLVNNNTHDQLTSIYFNLANAVTEIVSTIIKKTSPHTMKKIVSKNESNINSIIISDSILFWANGSSNRDFFNILIVVSKLLTKSIFLGLPMRGAITLGPLTTIKLNLQKNFDNSISTFIGKSISKSFELEKKQQWHGCVVDEECINHFQSQLNDTDRSSKSLKDFIMGIMMNYNVPMKVKSENMHAVKWGEKRKGIDMPVEMIEFAFMANQKKSDDNSVKEKIKNTVEYFNSLNI